MSRAIRATDDERPRFYSGVEPVGGRPLIVEYSSRILYYSEDRYGDVCMWVVPDEIGFIRSGDVT